LPLAVIELDGIRDHGRSLRCPPLHTEHRGQIHQRIAMGSEKVALLSEPNRLARQLLSGIQLALVGE
jgi:hypothetical protein